MQKAVKQALLIHLGLTTEQRIAFPPCAEEVGKFYSSSQLHLSLSETKSDEKIIIDFLKKIPRGFRNSYCKNLTRYYLETPTQFKIYDNKICL